MSNAPNLNFQNLKLGIAPREGLKALGLTLPVTPTGFALDLTLEQIKSQISQLEMLYVDNADNAFPVSAYMGGTGQRITCPPNSQAYFFLLLPNPPKLIFTAQSNINLNIQLLNFRMNPLIWNVLQGTMINPNQIALPDGEIIIGNATGVGQARAMTGDIALSDIGVATIQNGPGLFYQTGPWTPVDNSGAGLIFSFPTGNFVRVGKFCLCSFSLTYPATANGLTMAIGGFPFTANIGCYEARIESTIGDFIGLNGGSPNVVVRNSGGGTYTNAGLSGQIISGTIPVIIQ